MSPGGSEDDDEGGGYSTHHLSQYQVQVTNSHAAAILQNLGHAYSSQVDDRAKPDNLVQARQRHPDLTLEQVLEKYPYLRQSQVIQPSYLTDHAIMQSTLQATGIGSQFLGRDNSRKFPHSKAAPLQNSAQINQGVSQIQQNLIPRQSQQDTSQAFLHLALSQQEIDDRKMNICREMGLADIMTAVVSQQAPRKPQIIFKHTKDDSMGIIFAHFLPELAPINLTEIPMERFLLGLQWMVAPIEKISSKKVTVQDKKGATSTITAPYMIQTSKDDVITHEFLSFHQTAKLNAQAHERVAAGPNLQSLLSSPPMKSTPFAYFQSQAPSQANLPMMMSQQPNEDQAMTMKDVRSMIGQALAGKSNLLCDEWVDKAMIAVKDPLTTNKSLSRVLVRSLALTFNSFQIYRRQENAYDAFLKGPEEQYAVKLFGIDFEKEDLMNVIHKSLLANEGLRMIHSPDKFFLTIFKGKRPQKLSVSQIEDIKVHLITRHNTSPDLLKPPNTVKEIYALYMNCLEDEIVLFNKYEALISDNVTYLMSVYRTKYIDSKKVYEKKGIDFVHFLKSGMFEAEEGSIIETALLRTFYYALFEFYEDSIALAIQNPRVAARLSAIIRFLYRPPKKDDFIDAFEFSKKLTLEYEKAHCNPDFDASVADIRVKLLRYFVDYNTKHGILNKFQSGDENYTSKLVPDFLHCLPPNLDLAKKNLQKLQAEDSQKTKEKNLQKKQKEEKKQQQRETQAPNVPNKRYASQSRDEELSKMSKTKAKRDRAKARKLEEMLSNSPGQSRQPAYFKEASNSQQRTPQTKQPRTDFRSASQSSGTDSQQRQQRQDSNARKEYQVHDNTYVTGRGGGLVPARGRGDHRGRGENPAGDWRRGRGENRGRGDRSHYQRDEGESRGRGYYNRFREESYHQEGQRSLTRGPRGRGSGGGAYY